MKTLLTTLLLLTSINIAYAAQTCRSDVINSTPDSRYTNNNNGTITDNNTRLVWKQCSEGQTINSNHNDCTGTASKMNWLDALTLADSTTFANNSDWQLPNVKQLTSIVSDNCYNPSINQTHFPNTPRDFFFFWSSSLSVHDSSNAWNVYFYNGYALNRNRSDGHYVRLVRPMP